jgi:hypothetical protein
MATFRKVHTQFWSDLFIQSLSPEKKYFYIYLLTNEKTRQCGIYEISSRQISFDTGYNVETVLILLEYFVDQKKIMVSRETNEIAIKNWERYNGSRSPDVKSLVDKELKLVKNKKLIEWVQSVDTVLPQSKSSLREEEKKKENRIEQDSKSITIEKEMTKKEFLEFSEKMKKDELFIQPLFSAGVKKEHLEKWISIYHVHIVGDNKLNKDYNEYRKHFKNWLRKQDYFNAPPNIKEDTPETKYSSTAAPLKILRHD